MSLASLLLTESSSSPRLSLLWRSASRRIRRSSFRSIARFVLLVLFVGAIAAARSAVAVDEPDNLHSQMMRSMVKLAHDRSTAGGFVLAVPAASPASSPAAANGADAKYVLITANHVLENTPGEETTVIFRKRLADGEFAKEPMKLAIRKGDKPLWVKHATEDVAVIAVTPPAGADLPGLSIDLLASDADWKQHRIGAGTNVTCLGYPHREESSAAGFPILRDGPIASFPLLPTAKTKKFTLSMNSFEGDSGGPVYLSRADSSDASKEQTRLILGLVSAQQFLDEEMRTLYGAQKVRHRLGLALIVHASVIRETVEKWKGQ